MRRWWWEPPSVVPRPWRPAVYVGADEYCNPTVGIVLPGLGMAVVRYRPGRLRTVECEECRGSHLLSRTIKG